MMTTRRASLCLVLAAACGEGGTSRTELTVHSLQNTGLGYLREFARRSGSAGEMGEPERPPDGGGMIVPDPGGECPYFEYREEHTVVVGPDGQIVSETWGYCSRCLDADGNTIGEETCVDEPLLPPDVSCSEYGDGTTACYQCVAPDGSVVDGGCTDDPLPPFPTDPMDPGGCEVDLCTIDPYCCEVEWDRLCDLEKTAACGCDGSFPGEPPLPPDEPPLPPDDCVVRFCETAPTCCEGAWDATCDATFLDVCGGADGGAPGEMPKMP